MRYETTAKRLRYAMDALGISQQELANRAGVGKSSISHYINGTNEPGNKAAYKLASVLKVDPAWLMGFDVPVVSEDTPAISLSPIEKEIILAYRKASPDMQAGLCAFLGIKGDTGLLRDRSIGE